MSLLGVTDYVVAEHITFSPSLCGGGFCMAIKILDNVHCGKSVRLYRNLHHPHEGRFSVQGEDYDGKTRVLGYVDRALMRGVTFYVSPSSRARALAKGEDGQRSVHAWATGHLLTQDFDEHCLPQPLIDIRYNYKFHKSFVESESGRAVDRADYLAICEEQVFIANNIETTFHPIQLSLFG